MKMKPLEQGDLDALCGVYSILNAYQIVHNSPVDELSVHFKTLINYLNSAKKLACVLKDGMHFKLVKELLKINLKNKTISTEMPFCNRKNPSIEEFLDKATEFLTEDRAILIGLSGSGLKSKKDHWSLIINVSDKCIDLFDSDGLKSIDIKLVSTDDLENIQFVLWPAQSIFISKG